jgi:hypothetical protein
MRESARKPPARCAVPCHKAIGRASEERLRGHQKRPKISAGGRGLLQPYQLRADPVPDFVPERLERLDRADHGLKSGHFVGLVSNLIRSMTLICHLPILAENSSAASREPAIKLPIGLFSAPCGDGSAASSDGSTMKDEKDRRAAPAAKNPKPDSRQDRLKLALRENLKRRKSRARGRGDPAPASSHDDQAAPHDDGGSKPGG